MLPPTILLAVISYHVLTSALRPGYINTFAGTGLASYGGDKSAATSAWLNGPQGVAVDSSNNVFIADTVNNRIRFVSRTTGIITTYAGIGTAGYDGDYGPASRAQLNSPYGMVVDVSNNVYIADYGNNKVRLVTASSLNISTYAGQGNAAFGGDGYPASSAYLNGPSSLAFDNSGNLWIVDSKNERVRLVTKSTGYITSYYDTSFLSSKQQSGASSCGVAFDASGNNLVAIQYSVCCWTYPYKILIITQSNAATTYVGGGSSTNELSPATSFALSTTSYGGFYSYGNNPYSYGISLDAYGNLYFAT